ncbi:alpha-galactosidase [Anaerosacchariphilus polymeriproducens]|uniref:Alpha-galactosidase n=2 Tax=Anaerosacchariphilus polymeriproducens TaxID=1812858 RepID=A0A371ASZ0_9FIRM|nr:alpha-galactosidase [Anaerosacchariphilus polymeriproducens]
MYQMCVDKLGYLLHLYYGSTIENEDLDYLIRYIDRACSGQPYDALDDRTYSLDILPQEYSTFGSGDYRTSSILVENSDGSQTVDLRFKEFTIYEGKYKLQGLPSVYAKEEADTLEIILEDKHTNMEVVLLYGVFKNLDVITRAVRVKNNGAESVYLNRVLSTCLDFYENKYDFISFYGKHMLERQLERRHLTHGKTSVESVRGVSSHHQNPFVILCDRKADEDIGDCYGFSFVYSGNFLAETEVDQINQTRFVMGINPTGFRYCLKSQEEFIAPEVVMVFSQNGLGELSRIYHDVYRDHLCRGNYAKKQRPVLINNWEATYFDFDEQKILDIASMAADVGIEMLVMDDGWFGKRNNDLAGLGDWVVNHDKIPSGINGLCQKINDLGIKMGLWFEPEMVNEDSDLYRAHPDWCIKVPERSPVRARYQLVLDVSRKEVRDYIFDLITKVLDGTNIEYIKWDMNRNLTDLYSAGLSKESQGELFHRYVLGVYDLMERLIQRYPNILLENCSGGGGRFDPGMLYYSPQIWCSDNTDAIDRIKIQYGTSFGYPISSMGAHVSVTPNHGNGRCTDFKTRGIVAMAGTFGYELDITKLSDEEKDMIQSQIEEFKRNYDVIQYGDYYRLTDVMNNHDFAAWQFVDKQKTKSLCSYVSLTAKANAPTVRLRLKGLDASKKYRINKEDKIYSGDLLMKAGFVVPETFGDYKAINFEILEVQY